jgi:hypothetical protein
LKKRFSLPYAIIKEAKSQGKMRGFCEVFVTFASKTVQYDEN